MAKRELKATLRPCRHRPCARIVRAKRRRYGRRSLRPARAARCSGQALLSGRGQGPAGPPHSWLRREHLHLAARGARACPDPPGHRRRSQGLRPIRQAVRRALFGLRSGRAARAAHRGQGPPRPDAGRPFLRRRGRASAWRSRPISGSTGASRGSCCSTRSPIRSTSRCSSACSTCLSSRRSACAWCRPRCRRGSRCRSPISTTARSIPRRSRSMPRRSRPRPASTPSSTARGRSCPRTSPSSSERYKTIALPTLILWCDHDRIVPLEVGLKLRRTLAQLDLAAGRGLRAHAAGRAAGIDAPAAQGLHRRLIANDVQNWRPARRGHPRAGRIMSPSL